MLYYHSNRFHKMEMITMLGILWIVAASMGIVQINTMAIITTVTTETDTTTIMILISIVITKQRCRHSKEVVITGLNYLDLKRNK